MTEFITRNHGNSCFEIIIKTTNPEHYKTTQDFARRLIDHAKPMTNADRIRAMSDKELAWFFAEKYAKEAVMRVRESLHEPTATEIKALTETLYHTWLRWLIQPVELNCKNCGEQSSCWHGQNKEPKKCDSYWNATSVRTDSG